MKQKQIATDVVGVRLPRWQSVRLRDIAQSRNVPYGHVMREAIVAYLDDAS